LSRYSKLSSALGDSNDSGVVQRSDRSGLSQSQ